MTFMRLLQRGMGGLLQSLQAIVMSMNGRLSLMIPYLPIQLLIDQYTMLTSLSLKVRVTEKSFIEQGCNVCLFWWYGGLFLRIQCPLLGPIDWLVHYRKRGQKGINDSQDNRSIFSTRAEYDCSGRKLWIYGQLSAALRVAHIPTALLLLLLKYFKKNKTKGLIKIRFLIKRG